jgi:hypothetical protein
MVLNALLAVTRRLKARFRSLRSSRYSKNLSSQFFDLDIENPIYFKKNQLGRGTVPLGPVKICTEYLAQIETAISIIYGKYVYTYG